MEIPRAIEEQGRLGDMIGPGGQAVAAKDGLIAVVRAIIVLLEAEATQLVLVYLAHCSRMWK